MDSSNNAEQKPAGQGKKRPRKRRAKKPAGGASNNDPAKPSDQKGASWDGMKTSRRQSGGRKAQANPEVVPCSPQKKNQSVLQPFKWQHPEGKDDIFQKEIMKYISSRPEDLGRLELEMKKANANVSIAADHVAVKPTDNFASQTAGNWRKECERILHEFFAQFTVRTQTVDTFSPGTEHDDPAVDVHLHSIVKGVVTISVTGRLKDAEQKIHQLKGKEHQEQNNTTLHVPLQRLHKLEDDFVEDRNSQIGFGFSSHEKDDLTRSVAQLGSQYSHRQPRDGMHRISVPLTDSQALALTVCREALEDIKLNVDSKVKIDFKRGIPALVIKGKGEPLKEGHVAVVEQLQYYNDYCILDMKIDDTRDYQEMRKMIGKGRKNVDRMQSQHGVEITYTFGKTNARHNVSIIGEENRVKKVEKIMVRRHSATTVEYRQYKARTKPIRRPDSTAHPQSALSLDGDKDDRLSETSSVSDCAANPQSVLYQWPMPYAELLDFVKRSEVYTKQFDGLFSSDESALIEETYCAVTVAGQATDPEVWQYTIDTLLQRFFGNFDCCEVQFHPRTTVDKTDFDNGELTVKWEDDACVVCGVKERVSDKLAEFEIIKNRKQSVAVEFPCDKNLVSFMRKNLNINDEGFNDNGHVTVRNEHVAFQSEIAEVDSVEDWKAGCRIAIDEILHKLDCSKLKVPPIYHGHMRKECRQSNDVSVEWCQEDSCLAVSGWKDCACREFKRLQDLLYDLENKKKTVTMRYRCEEPEIAAFVAENTKQLENLVKHMERLGSPVLDGDTSDTFVMHGDILETESTAEWEEECRVKFKQYFLRYKSSKVDVGHLARGFCMALAKSGSNVAVRWIDEENCLLIVGIKSLVNATKKSLRGTMEEEIAHASLQQEGHSVDRDKDTTLTIHAADSTFKWLERNKQMQVIRDVKYRMSDAGIEISGKDLKVQEVKTLIDSISVKELAMERYGVYKFLKEMSTSWLIEEIEINCNCVVQIDRLPDTEYGNELFVQLPKKSIGSITFEIKDGDITREDVDVIVNTTDETFSFDGPLSRCVLREAGEYLRNMRTVDHNIRYSDAGNLKCQKIIHVAIPKTHESMEDLLLKVLRQADEMGMKSIALPAIGGGNGGWNNQDIAKAMKNAFEIFETESVGLKKIVVVLYARSLVAVYENILKQEQSSPAPVEQKRGFFGFLAWLLPKAPEPVPEPPPKAEPTPAAPAKAASADTGQHAIVTVSAESKDNLNKAVEELQAMTDRFIKDYEINSVAVLRISESDLSKIEKMAKEHDVRVIVNKKNDVHSITIQGNNDDASKVKDKVKEIVSGISTDLPKNWISSDEKMISVKLDPHSAEYQDIEKLFHAANKGPSFYFSVEQIDRIQNLSLYRLYQSKKEEISRRQTPPANVKMRLFHGTDKASMDCICLHGFNRSYAGKNAAIYGKGTYFSTESSYSNSYARKEGFTGRQRMFVAEVLTGDYCQGNGSMVDAPQKNSTGELYDSVVDQCRNPTIYVVFKDWSAYPSYVITYNSY